jgi:hypothetical protein
MMLQSLAATAQNQILQCETQPRIRFYSVIHSPESDFTVWATAQNQISRYEPFQESDLMLWVTDKKISN